MKINISDLLKVTDIDKYNLYYNRADPLYMSIFVMDQKTNSESKITSQNLEKLQVRSQGEISIITDDQFRKDLKKINPEVIQNPTNNISLDDLINQAKNYEFMNLKSHKKRSLIILDDVCATQANESSLGKQLLMEYGSRITPKLIEKIDHRVNSLSTVKYRDSEDGVLVYIPEPKDFKLKVDLFAILASLDLEIFDAKDSSEAIELYQLKSPKLVILGDINESIDAKKTILELEKIDPFMKKLNYKESPASNRKFETDRIKKSYFSGYSNLLEIINKKKDNLPEEIKKELLTAIKRIDQDYSEQDYVETAYTLKQIGRMFNVIQLWNMLENIKNDRIGRIS